MKDIEQIKLEWQKHNRDNGMSWNEVSTLVDEVAKLHRPHITEEEIKKAISKYEDVITEFLIGIGVDAGEANNAREELIKKLINR